MRWGVKEKLTEFQKNIKQMPFRLHANDKAVFMKLLSDHGYNFQMFANFCMQAFLNGDPAIMKVLKDWKALNEVPKDQLERYTLSHRERDRIQAELDQMNAERDVNLQERK